MLPKASKLKWLMVSIFFCFYNQQLSALSLISVTGNKCLVFPAPDLLVHSKLNQQSKEMLICCKSLVLHQVPDLKAYQMPLYFFLLQTGFLKADFIKAEVRYIWKRLIIHSGTVVSSLGIGTKEIDVDFPALNVLENFLYDLPETFLSCLQHLKDFQRMN